MWQKIKVPTVELQLKATLKAGQTFHWVETGANEWTSAFEGKLLSLRQEDDGISFLNHSNDAKTDFGLITDKLREYFQLDLLCLKEQYEKWSKADPHFQQKASKIPGVRILRQDPLENILSFICSSNNNISRISQMVQKLCRTYGTNVGTYNSTDFYTFPSLLELLKEDVEPKLRELGFGYRAKYIAQSSRQILEFGGNEWFLSLRKMSFLEARLEIQKLSGVGPKVADCVCLMSLDKSESIPVDTHVFQIATRDYEFLKDDQFETIRSNSETEDLKTTPSSKKLKSSRKTDLSSGKIPKTLTPAIYLKIVENFQRLFGDHAGWAHSVLFAADLPEFKKEAVHQIKFT